VYAAVILWLILLISGFIIGWFSSQHHHAPPRYPVAKFIVPDWREKVDSGIGLP
jgi:hypothetical protein